MILLLALGCAPRPTGTEAPLTPAPSCPAGEIADGADCVPERCGVGPFGDVEADLFVDPSSPGGDGSREAPFSAVDEAMVSNRRVALAAGTYPGPLTPGAAQDGLVLVGRCPDLVVVDGSTTEEAFTLVDRVEVGLEALTVRGGRVVVGGKGTLRAAGVTVTDAPEVGVYLADGGHLVFDGGSITGTVHTRADGTGYGLYVEDGADAIVSNSTLVENAGVGVYVNGYNSRATLDTVAIRDTRPDQEGWGIGIITVGGAHLVGTGVEVTGSRYAAVLSAGGDLSLTDCTLSGTTPRDDGLAGEAAFAQSGGSLSLTACTVTDNTGGGLGVVDAGSTLTATDTTVTHNPSAGADQGGVGAGASSGGTLVLTRVQLEDNETAGVSGWGEGTRLTLVDTTVTGTRPGDASGGGSGVALDAGAVLEMSGGSLDQNVVSGILLLPGSTAVLSGVHLAANLPDADGLNGYGITNLGGTLEGESLVLTDNHTVGVYAESPTTLRGSTVADTHMPLVGLGGYGVTAYGPDAAVTLVDTTVSGNAGCGVLASEGAALTMEGGEVRANVRNSTQADAFGVIVQRDATAHLDGVQVTDNHGPGLAAVTGATVEASGLTLSGNGFAGLIVGDATLDFAHGTVAHTETDAELGGGVGVYAFGWYGPATLSLTGSEVRDNPVAAVWVDGPGTYRVAQNRLLGGAGIALTGGLRVNGNAVYARGGTPAWDGQSGLHITENQLEESAVAVLLDGASAALEGNTWAANAVDLVQQRCAATTPVGDPDGAPEVNTCPEHDLLALPLDYRTVFSDPDAGSGGAERP